MYNLQPEGMNKEQKQENSCFCSFLSFIKRNRLKGFFAVDANMMQKDANIKYSFGQQLLKR